MIILVLQNTTTTLELEPASAPDADVPVHVSFLEQIDQAQLTKDRSLAELQNIQKQHSRLVSGSATAATVLSAPAAGRRRGILSVYFRNTHSASLNYRLRVKDTAATPASVDVRFTLATLDVLVWDSGGLKIYDDDGSVRTVGAAVSTHNVLSVTHGDTTASTVARGDLIVGTGAVATWDNLVVGAASRFLQSDGTDVSWVAMSGDATLAAGVITVAANAIGNTKLRDSGALSVIGRSANSAGDPADISATAASDAVMRESGSGLGFGTVATAGIANDAVTYAKIQDISVTERLLGRNSAGAGDPQEVTANMVLNWIGSTQGQILYRNAANWTVLNPGTAGQVLETAGAGANPAWATGGGGAAAATQAEMEAASSTTVYASPGRTQNHPGVAKAWSSFSGTSGALDVPDWNMDDSTDSGTGDFTANFTTDFSDANYAITGMCRGTANDMTLAVQSLTTAPAVGSCRLRILDTSATHNYTDCTTVFVCAHGDQ